MLAPFNCCSENIIVEPIVVSELKLSDVQRQIFRGDFVERANYATLEDRPEALDCVGVDSADNILAACMVDSGVGEVFVEVLVADPLIGAEQANFGGNGFADELSECRSLHILNNAGDDIAFTADRTSNDGLARSTSRATATTLANVTVLGFSADESFINFDNAAELGFRLHERGAYFVGHIQGGFIRAEAHHTLDLKRTNPLLAGEHEVNDAEPLPQGFIRVLEDGPGDDREPISLRATGGALGALPVEARRQRIDLGIAAAGTMDPFRPTPDFQVGLAGFLVGEHGLELGDGHLMDGLGAAHGVSSLVGGYSHG
jgi:hypothetical protein